MSVADHMKAEVNTFDAYDGKFVVTGLGRFYFSTQKDADEAIEFAKAVSRADRRAMGEKLSQAVAVEVGC